ncbi:MAG: hypothetical protein ACI4XN_13845 [Candidatus Kurthia intestinigallinarum]
MATVEILGGNGLKNAFKDLGIKATKTYHGKEEPHYQVWEIDKRDVKAMENMVEWPDRYGWWRFAKGSNMGTPYSIFTVNGCELIAWDGLHRGQLYQEWMDEPDEEKEAYHYSFKEYEETQYPHTYKNLTEYLCEELGASTEKNVCALAVDLARANGFTMAELFEKYEG